jgi:phage pi2 protein 07
MISNKRYVILNTSNFNDKKLFIHSKLDLENSVNGSVTYSNGIFFEIDEIKKKININQNDNKDWVFFNNINFKNWTINFNGMVKNPDNSALSQRLNSNGLTGCLNFLNSSFENTSIKMKNGFCEDSVNIINSEGKIKSIYITNAFSDALDLDFSNLFIENLFVSNAGNDCFDVSGGKYKVAQSMLFDCKDKALSIGEISEFNATKIDISNSNIGISVKDFSRSLIESYNTTNVSICAEVLQKKQEFGGAIANFKDVKCDGVFNKDVNSLINHNYNEL